MFYVRRQYLSGKYDSLSSAQILSPCDNLTLRKKRKNFSSNQRKSGNNFSLSLDQNYEEDSYHSRCSLVFEAVDQVGGLMKVIQIFKRYNINIRHIESREMRSPKTTIDNSSVAKENVVPSTQVDRESEGGEKLKQFFYCDLDGDAESLVLAIKVLKNCVMEFTFNDSSIFVSKQPGEKEGKSEERSDDLNNENWNEQLPKPVMPWYPTRVRELDKIANRVFMAGIDLDSDHPGFHDPVYTSRRKMFAEISFNYKHGDPIPFVEYTDEENKTWSTVYGELKRLYIEHACREYMVNLPLLELYCGYADGKVPQLNLVNNFLLEKTGFSLRPVAGYLSSRDFLSALAFRVFCCTQYIRHASDPFYTPEPDCCHELLGHVPMLADRTFADFSQEIGLASLGASDEDVEKLSKLYFFTVEFGLCRQDGQVKIYGAGLLSSVGELKHSMEDKEKQREFSLCGILDMTCNITTFQDAYFVNSSFETAKQEMRSFASSIKRGFDVKYNPYTRSIDVLKSTNEYLQAISSAQLELNELLDGLKRYTENTTATEKRLGVRSNKDWTNFIDNLCPKNGIHE